MDKIFENRLIFEEGRERSANSPVGFCSEQPPVGGMIRLYTFVGCRGPYSPDPLSRFAPRFLVGIFFVLSLAHCVYHLASDQQTAQWAFAASSRQKLNSHAMGRCGGLFLSA